MAQDYYTFLKVRRSATQDEIKQAYRRRAREMHPDVNSDPETQEKFKEVTRAYAVLSDADQRRLYDLGEHPYQQNQQSGRSESYSYSDDPDDRIDLLIASMGKQGPYILDYMVRRGEMDIAEKMLALGVRPLQMTLLRVVERGEPEWVKAFIDDGAQPGPGMLHYVVERAIEMDGVRLRHDMQEVAAVLAAAGVIPDEKTLDLAVRQGRTDWMQWLIDKGAKPTSKMLHHAVECRNVQSADILIEAGASPAKKTLRLVRKRKWEDWEKKLTNALAKNPMPKRGFRFFRRRQPAP